MRKWFWMSDQFEVLKEKQWLWSNSKRTKYYLWLVCNREVWAPGTTDEKSFLITSLTDAFSIHSQAFNAGFWEQLATFCFSGHYTHEECYSWFFLGSFFFGAAFFSLVRGFAPKFPSLPIRKPATQVTYTQNTTPNNICYSAETIFLRNSFKKWVKCKAVKFIFKINVGLILSFF